MGTNLEFTVGNMTYEEIDSEGSEEVGVPVGAIVGATVGAIAVAVLLVIIIVVMCFSYWNKIAAMHKKQKQVLLRVI